MDSRDRSCLPLMQWENPHQRVPSTLWNNLLLGRGYYYEATF